MPPFQETEKNAKTAVCRWQGLDTLWIQVTGLKCNLSCAHCFNSSGPKNGSLAFLTREEVRGYLDEAEKLGAREIAFTGGEPFLHGDMPLLLGDSLERFATTVLTNGVLLRDSVVGQTARIARNSPYSLEVRISLDSPEGPANDALRGQGVFQKALEGARRLSEAGLLPILTAVRSWPMERDLEVLNRFEEVLRAAGVAKPRVKFLPTLQLGRETQRSGGYRPEETVTPEMLDAVAPDHFLCASSRLATSRGIYPCPLLVNEPSAWMGRELGETLEPYPLRHGACTTCYRYGAICSNPTLASLDEGKA